MPDSPGTARDAKRAVAEALDERDLFVSAVLAGYSTRDDNDVIVVNVILSRFERNDVAFIARIEEVVTALGGEIEGAGCGRVVALFEPRG